MVVEPAVLFPDLEGHWLSTFRADPRAAALYRRHYSSSKNPGSRVSKAYSGRIEHNFMGPGETLVLLTADCRALFAWQRNVGAPRLDKQDGVNCTVFRNEGPVLSSDLIREAQEIAWRRWPGERLFTYVWDSKIKSVNPGYCFKKAGWRVCGRNADGRLTILEILPSEGHAADRSAPESDPKEVHSQTPQAGRGAGLPGRRSANVVASDVLFLSDCQGCQIDAGREQDRRPATRPSNNETPGR